MTAIDAGVQSKLLGAEDVTICYRRGKEDMNASGFEQDLAAANGVTIRHWLQPKRVISHNGKVTAIELEYTAMKDGKLAGTGELLTLPADQVFKAIGQTFVSAALNGSGASIESSESARRCSSSATCSRSVIRRSPSGWASSRASTPSPVIHCWNIRPKPRVSHSSR
ncbi:MAG TPA: hypothetical protein PKA20_16820 [Burkholderiaceae bacterium]|nr:hypothetical protein [Burkholderiaceae bacterium]